ncbi:hypothetical protein [Haloglomus halophilum]|uniref:hypothetical protein n=1 Tax=Haloglomus halophilum TaxID=2962672 RepID=UPI0020CA1B99|nr:hypothetical protein [Haloglomus halophilum]
MRQRARVLRDKRGGGGGASQHTLFGFAPGIGLVPLVGGDLVSSLLGAAGIGVSGTLIALIAVALYGRKALQAGEAAGQTVRYLIVIAGVLVLGLLTRVIPTLRVSRAIELGAGIVHWLVSVVGGVLA